MTQGEQTEILATRLLMKGITEGAEQRLRAALERAAGGQGT